MSPDPTHQAHRLGDHDRQRRVGRPGRAGGPISAGFGSPLAGWLRLSAQDRRIAVATGMGAGIGAIFRAPLGGALMAAEMLYGHLPAR